MRAGLWQTFWNPCAANADLVLRPENWIKSPISKLHIMAPRLHLRDTEDIHDRFALQLIIR
jgi:hypothetical protein